MLFLVFLHQDVGSAKDDTLSWKAFFSFPHKCLYSIADMLNTPDIFWCSGTLSKRPARMNSPKATSSPCADGEHGSAAGPLPPFFSFPGVPGVILIVGHGSSLASLTRALAGLPSRDSGNFAQMVRKVRGFHFIRKPLGCFIIFLIRRLLMQQDLCSSTPTPMTSVLSFQRESHTVLAKHSR